MYTGIIISMMNMPPENYQVGSTGGTQLPAPLETFRFLRVKGEFWTGVQ